MGEALDGVEDIARGFAGEDVDACFGAVRIHPAEGAWPTVLHCGEWYPVHVRVGHQGLYASCHW